MIIPFTKMQAYGNDYVYIDATRVKVDNWTDLAIKVSNRHFGIGSDGMILICNSDVCDFRMRVFDPDGTECEMCGNALRSVAKFVYYYKMTDKTEFTIETIGGHQQVSLDVADGEVAMIHANIGKPVFDPEKIAVDITQTEAANVVDITQKFIDVPVEILDRTFRMSSLSWGNPHTVMFIDDVDGNECIDIINCEISGHKVILALSHGSLESCSNIVCAFALNLLDDLSQNASSNLLVNACSLDIK